MVRKTTMVKQIQKQLGLKSYNEALHIYDTISDINIKLLKEGDGIKIPGIGILKKKTKKARTIIVPGKTEPVKVPARKGIFFTVNKDFEKSLK
jgi:nucleoid DNA-binding protein